MLAGKVVQQVWGAKWERCGAAEEEAAAWLVGLQDSELPPMDVAMQECVLAPIQERVGNPHKAQIWYLLLSCRHL